MSYCSPPSLLGIQYLWQSTQAKTCKHPPRGYRPHHTDVTNWLPPLRLVKFGLFCGPMHKVHGRDKREGEVKQGSIKMFLFHHTCPRNAVLSNALVVVMVILNINDIWGNQYNSWLTYVKYNKLCVHLWGILYVVHPCVLYIIQPSYLSAQAVCFTGYRKATNDAIQQSGTNYPSEILISV